MWDLDGDGQFDDAAGVSPNYIWSDDYGGSIGLKVTDEEGLNDVSTTTVLVANVAPSEGNRMSAEPVELEIVIPEMDGVSCSG